MSLKTALAALLLAGIAFSPALAQSKTSDKDRDKDKKDEKPPAAAQDFSKEAYVLEKLNTRIVAEDDGGGTRERTAEIRILAEAGVKTFAVLSFTYTSANEVVDVDYVRVRKPDGTIVKTPDYNIQDMPGEVTRSAPLYSDIHEKHIAVKGLAVGDVLEYLVRYRVVKPEVPGHFWFEDSFVKDAIVKAERLEISVPAAKYVKVSSPDFKPEVREEGTRRIYVWSHSNLAVPEKDPREAPRRTLPTPSVQVTTFRNWEEVGAWYGGLQKEPLAVTPDIQAKAAELTKGLTTDDAKTRAIYNFVALKFHYIGLDFGIGRYQPHAADDVLGNGYGDCKDKHTLMAALLKGAGIDAWPALINASRKLDPEVPSPAQFNHVITVVPNGGKFIWLDTTPEVAPYQLLMVTLRDKQALVIPTDKPPLLMTTPAIPLTPQEQRFTSEGKLDANGTFTGHVEQLYRGDVEVALRSMFRQLSQSQWKEGVQRFSYALGFGGDVSNVVVTPADETDKPFRISYDYVRKSYGGWDDHQITPPIPPNLGVESSKDAKKPKESVLLGAPGDVVYESKLTLPSGYSVEAPKGLDLVEPYAEYHATAKVENGVLISSRRLVVKKAEVALDNWESFRDFGKAIYDDEWRVIPVHSDGVGINASREDLDQKFREASQDLQRGNRSGAQQLLEQIVRSDPKYPLAHLNLGVVLMMQSKTTEGFAEWQKEKETNPDDPHVYQVTAAYLTFMNRKDEAIQDWRKVLKLDPKNHEAAIGLSQVLASEDKNADAVTVLEDAVKGSPGITNLEYALGSAYLKTGQSENAVTHLRAAVDASKGDDSMLLNNVAYTLAENKTSLDLAQQYGEQAIKQLDKRSEKDVENLGLGTQVTYQFSLAWDTLGWVYFQNGDNTRAENFVRAAWYLGQDATVGEHLGEIYEKQGKPKEAAHVYELALSAIGTPLYGLSGTPPPYPGMPLASPAELNRQALATKVATRYQKLTGKKPAINETWRLPNGEWTKSASEQLSLTRTAKFGKIPNLSGSAEFTVVFAPGKIESVTYVSGEQSLKALTEKIKAARYQIEFPAGSQAKLLRRAETSCFPMSGCMAVLMPTDRALIRQNNGQY
jgi:tetratricopeptide (TPR) repeat protein/transglutaminase-like putative cysteine protease